MLGLGRKEYGFVIGLGLATTLVLILLTKTKVGKKFIFPVQGKITSGFGLRTHPITGTQKFHNGIDIAVPEGTPLKSPLNGVVETSSYDSVNGHYVIIRHDNGYKTGYAHLSQKLVKKGDKVEQGQIFAKSGNTGASTGAHLHFTVTNPQGEKIDPLKMIA